MSGVEVHPHGPAEASDDELRWVRRASDSFLLKGEELEDRMGGEWDYKPGECTVFSVILRHLTNQVMS